MRLWLVGLCLLVVVEVCFGYYHPGVIPIAYVEGDSLELKVTSITSATTAIPRSFYSLPTCRPSGGIQNLRKSFIEVLIGDIIENSPIEIKGLQNKDCEELCVFRATPEDTFLLHTLIKENYRVHWVLDNLPLLYKKTFLEHNRVASVYELGFPLGFEADEGIALNNHQTIHILYNKPRHLKDGLFHIVGFEVFPESVQSLVKPVPLIELPSQEEQQQQQPQEEQLQEEQQGEDQHQHHEQFHHLYQRYRTTPEQQQQPQPQLQLQPEQGSQLHLLSLEQQQQPEITTCFPPSHSPPLVIYPNTSLEISWSYSVVWKEVNVPWTNRWDVYMTETLSQQRFQGLTLINSLLMIIFLSGAVALILGRALRSDLSRYSSNEEESNEGWKTVHGDVFRPPNHPLLLSALVGSGIQVCCVVCLALMTALGTPYLFDEKSLTTTLLPFFISMGFMAGYGGDLCYRNMGGETRPLYLSLLISFLYPGFVVAVYLIMHTFLWEFPSLSSPNIDTPYDVVTSLTSITSVLFFLGMLWCITTLPLTFLGSYVSHFSQPPQFPCRTNSSKRAIPWGEMPWYLSWKIAIPLGAIFPFSAVFFEVFFLLSSILLHQYFTIFGFLSVVFVVFVMTCAEIAIVSTYCQLCVENYHWWWRSFLMPAFSGFYMGIYALIYLSLRLPSFSFTPFIVYSGYTIVFSSAFGLMAGSIGFCSSLWFVKKIYSVVKVE